MCHGYWSRWERREEDERREEPVTFVSDPEPVEDEPREEDREVVLEKVPAGIAD